MANEIHSNGSIEVKVRASGFIQGAFYVPGESEDYGYHIHDQLASSMHDHVMNFKADLDIAGQKNTLYKVDVEPAMVTYPWSEAGPRSTMKLTKHSIERETGINWPANSKTLYILANNASYNQWGETRGYRIMPGSGIGSPTHLTFAGSETLGKSGAWAMKDLWVTKCKDDEARSASPRNVFNTQNPLVDFESFLDGEGVEQEDLYVLPARDGWKDSRQSDIRYRVLWFNLGNHHVPHSGDVPNTLQHTSASSVWFVPFNFFDRDVSEKYSQGVQLDLDRAKDGAAAVRYFGHHYQDKMVLAPVCISQMIKLLGTI